MMMKKLFTLLFSIIVLFTLTAGVYAAPGKSDEGNKNAKEGNKNAKHHKGNKNKNAATGKSNSKM